MASNSVARRPKSSEIEVNQAESAESVLGFTDVDPDKVRLAVARLYGQGYSRAQIARAHYRQILPVTKARNEEQWIGAVRMKLKRWEMSQDFRDLVYRHAVVKLDMSTPSILAGVGKAAKRGRVDAARLALELTGRHTPKGDQIVSNVTVQIANVPRPESRG